jgi:hypothetical protein
MTVLSCPSLIFLMIVLSLVLLFSPLRPLSFPPVSHFLLILVFNFSFTLLVSFYNKFDEGTVISLNCFKNVNIGRYCYWPLYV